MNKKELQKDIFEVNDKVNTQNKLIDKLFGLLNGKVNTQNWVNENQLIWNAFKDLYNFKEQIEKNLKFAVGFCKTCKHDTWQQIVSPKETYCFICGTTWETTTKQVTEVKPLKK
jgi:hypothetical protein